MKKCEVQTVFVYTVASLYNFSKFMVNRKGKITTQGTNAGVSHHQDSDAGITMVAGYQVSHRRGSSLQNPIDSINYGYQEWKDNNVLRTNFNSRKYVY